MSLELHYEFFMINGYTLILLHVLLICFPSRGERPQQPRTEKVTKAAELTCWAWDDTSTAWWPLTEYKHLGMPLYVWAEEA